MTEKRGTNKLIKTLAVLVLLPLSIIIPTLSLESYYAPTTNAQVRNTKSFAERKKQYRAQLKEALSTTDEQRIQLRCLAVQANIKTLATRSGEVQTKRVAAYSEITKEMDALSASLKNQAFETSELDKNIAELKVKVTAFQTTLADYKQTLEDLTVIDCSQDAASFKAALETARDLHTKLIGQVAEVRAFILNALKPSLQQVREELVSQQAAGESR